MPINALEENPSLKSKGTSQTVEKTKAQAIQTVRWVNRNESKWAYRYHNPIVKHKTASEAILVHMIHPDDVIVVENTNKVIYWMKRFCSFQSSLHSLEWNGHWKKNAIDSSYSFGLASCSLWSSNDYGVMGSMAIVSIESTSFIASTGHSNDETTKPLKQFFIQI